jgi:very-short-patch-repair endonuclease
MSGPRAPKPSPLAGEGAERPSEIGCCRFRPIIVLAKSETSDLAGREAGEGAFAATTDRARVLRSRLTDAERKLWYALRDRRFASAKFRRQVPIGPYVADFLSYETRLVIEVDGGEHAESARDRRRDRWFADNGFRVLRFWNNDVHSNLEGVLMLITDALRATPRPARAARGRPSPARGEGTGAPSLRSPGRERREYSS